MLVNCLLFRSLSDCLCCVFGSCFVSHFGCCFFFFVLILFFMQVSSTCRKNIVTTRKRVEERKTICKIENKIERSRRKTKNRREKFITRCLFCFFFILLNHSTNSIADYDRALATECKQSSLSLFLFRFASRSVSVYTVQVPRALFEYWWLQYKSNNNNTYTYRTDFAITNSNPLISSDRL